MTGELVTIDEAGETVYQAFLTAWAVSSFAALPSTFDNEAFTQPPGTFVRIVVRNLGSQQESLGGVGNRLFERRAAVFAQVFVPIDEGTKHAWLIARFIRNIFEGVTLSGLRFTSPVIREIGTSSKDNNFQVNVEAPFTYSEYK